MGRNSTIVFLITLAAGMVCTAGCKKEQEEHALPAKVPEIPPLKFEGPASGWPPHPQDRTNVVNIPWKELPGVLTEAETGNLRAAALKNAEAHTALGARFALTAVDPVEPEKGAGSLEGARAVRMTFYSYSNNAAVEVTMKGSEVQKVTRREGYQPPEGREDIRLATELASRDVNLRGKLKGLENTGLVTFPQQGRPGYGHRVLHVNFTKAGSDVPFFYALVDLTEQKVLRAGPVVPK
jgi:hypothetical protein